MRPRKVQIESILGKTIVEINKQYNKIEFICSDGGSFLMYHDQQCCEEVALDDVCGDLDDLLNVPILNINCKSDDNSKPSYVFYTLATQKGYVDFRWSANINTYYSTYVDIFELRRIPIEEFCNKLSECNFDFTLNDNIVTIFNLLGHDFVECTLLENILYFNFFSEGGNNQKAISYFEFDKFMTESKVWNYEFEDIEEKMLHDKYFFDLIFSGN